ncbi:ATP-dependent DNA helicase [Salix suchowensis]|nr:ATP-dependent DNA helicase [Salix suchowensis]
MATGVLEVNEEPPALDMMNWEGQIIDQTKDDSTDNITFNSEQQRALNIIKHHIVQEISLWSPEQLLMVMNGCGGTGKSVLIEVITQSMTVSEIRHCPIALPHDDSKTTGVLPNQMPCWQLQHGCLWGVNVILFRDLHQFPPVVKTGALYYSDMPSVGLSLGQRLFEAFTTVVTLTQQMRVRDPLWTVLLGRLRVGGCTKDAIVMTVGRLSKKYTVKRRQFALTPAYTFTDYKAQGQTIEHVIVDLDKSIKNSLDPFHACVSLSHSRAERP